MRLLSLYLQQLRLRLLPLALWTVLWAMLLVLFANVFNSFSARAAEAMVAFQQLPKEIFEAVNIDPTDYLMNVESFISGQFLFIYLLAGSIFALSLGIGVIGKKLENRTIASLLTKRLPRSGIYLVQFAVCATLLGLAGGLLGIFSWYAFTGILEPGSQISSDYFLWLFVGSTVLFIAFAALGQLLGTWLNGGKSLIVGAVIVNLSWYLNSLGELANLPEWSQRLSLYYYFDVALLRDQFALSEARSWWLVAITLALVVAGMVMFRQKDISL